MALITHQGISAAIANLRPNPDTLKGRLISIIHSYFPTEERLEEIDAISAEDLIRKLWEVDDPAVIHQKKKNLSSLKSSINKDLKKLARQGENPEGLIIGRDNVFTISDEHKDDLLQKLGLSSALDPKDILTLMRGILDSVVLGDGGREAASSLLKELDKTREIIAKAAGGIGDAPQHLATGTGIGDAAAGNRADGAAVAETATGGKSAASGGLAGGELTGSTGTDAGAEGTGGNEAESAVDEWLADEDFELLDEAEILEQKTEIAGDIIGGPDDGLAGGGLAGMGTDTGAELPGGAEDGPAALELLDQEEVELLDEAESLEQQVEIIDEDETNPVGEIGATDSGQRDAARPLDLSHYIEADEALASPPETLTESHDDYIAQILERFMPKFIKIPAGHYLTGRDQPAYNERPTRKIFLQSFYIAQLPVTNDLFDFFVRETGYETDAERAGFGNVVEGRISNRIDPDTGRNVLFINRGTRSRKTQGANWRHPAGPGTSLENKGNHPVVQVSRHDALAFAAWAGKRLPVEDEWEAAARGPEGLLFPWGNEWQGELANTEAALTGDTTPVIRHGKSSMSPFGIYDLLGNVFEWTATVHTPSRPVNTRMPPVYVLKGGCWTSNTGITTAARLLEPDTWSNIIGFRCAV